MAQGEDAAAPPETEVPRRAGGAEFEELERLLREIAATVRQRGRRALAGLGITPPQFDALIQLKRGGEMTMGDLCARLHLASSTVTDLIDRMERGGLAQRCRDATDRRVVRLRATQRGLDVIESVLRTRAAYLGDILGRLPEEGRLQIAGALRLLHHEVTRGDVP